MASIVTQAQLKTLLGLSSSISANEQAVLDIVHAQSESAVKSHIGYDPVQASRVQFYPRRRGEITKSSILDVNVSHTRAVFESTGSERQYLIVENIPVRSVTSVLVDSDGRFGEASGSFGAGTAWVIGEEFWPEWDDGAQTLCRSGVLVANGTWPSEPGTVKVTYTAGYTAAELSGSGINASGIQRAVMLTAVKAFNTWMSWMKKGSPISAFTAGPLQSERLQDYAYTLGAGGTTGTGMTVALPSEAENELEEYVHWGMMAL